MLADCDMLMTKSVDEVWEKDFDIAYTEREEGFQPKSQSVYKVVDGKKVRTGPKPHPGFPGGQVGAVVGERKYQSGQDHGPFREEAGQPKERGPHKPKPHPGFPGGIVGAVVKDRPYQSSQFEIVDGRKIRKAPPGWPGVWGVSKSRRWPPYNGGVMFIRPNEKSIKFMERQLAINNRMLKDDKFHRQYRLVYCGINQAAFGYMIENEADICNLLSLPCSEWNACDATWLQHDDSVRMVHIKSALRWMCVGKTAIQPGYEFLVRMWKDYEEMTFEDPIRTEDIRTEEVN
jgi:hypothetical protein